MLSSLRTSPNFAARCIRKETSRQCSCQSKNLSGTASVDIYKALEVPVDATISEIQDAYAKRRESQSGMQFSADYMDSRTGMATQAADDLLGCREDYQYNERLNVGTLPGDVSFLQETGRPEVIIELGETWFETNPPGTTGNKDVAAAMAKAYCDIADCGLRANKVGEAFDCLLKARAVLAEHNAGHDLADGIDSAIDQLAEEYLKRRLSLAIVTEPHCEKRELALAYLDRALWHEDGPLSLSSPRRQQILTTLRGLLSTSEVLWLYRGAPDHLPAAEAYEVAFALIAEGVEQAEPQMLATASNRLVELSRRMDVRVERAVCSLLLGDAPAAQAALRVRRGLQGDTLDNDAEAFIADYGDSDEERLAGLCALVEKWIAGVLRPEIRNISWTGKFSLELWGSTPSVQEYFELQESRSPVFGMLRSLAHFLAHVQSFFSDAITVLLSPFVRAAELARTLFNSVCSLSPFPRSVTLLTLAAAFAGVVLAAVKSQSLLPPSAAEGTSHYLPSSEQAQAGKFAVSRVASEHVSHNLNMVDVKATVLAWMEVKALALGPSHEIAALDSVLQGDMLKQWRIRANHMKRNNWHWNFDVSKIKILKAQQLTKDTASVTVKMVEKADAMFKNDKRDSYERTVCLEYHLVNEDGGWHISGSRLVG